MKKLIHIALGLALVFGMSSCEDYLDVNTDPDNPVSETVSPQLRLPWIQNYYAYAWGTASMRTNTIAGIMTQTGGTAANSLLSSWNPAQSSCTTIYQNFYLGAGVNIDPLIEKAEAEGAYHYEGAAYCIKAMGFMMMLDLHGEQTYSPRDVPRKPYLQSASSASAGFSEASAQASPRAGTSCSKAGRSR